MALTDQQIPQANQAGVLIDGLSLRLKINATGNGALSKRWALRYTSPDGRRREAGLGGFPKVSLSEARKRAAGLRQDVGAGPAAPLAAEFSHGLAPSLPFVPSRPMSAFRAAARPPQPACTPRQSR
jgi:hypothetical protein